MPDIELSLQEFDVSHTVHKLSFGRDYPGRKNPLDAVNVPRVNPHNPRGVTGTYQYFLKVAPALTSGLKACDAQTLYLLVQHHHRSASGLQKF